LTYYHRQRLSVIFDPTKKLNSATLIFITTTMGNKRIIVNPNGTYRKVCEKTQKIILETNFCWCGNKHCHEGFRMNSEKALCKVRRFRMKFRPILIDDYYDEKNESADAEVTDVSPECSTFMLSS
jgi:hypothetical protein